MQIRDFRASLGRLAFACSLLSDLRPLLGPLYAWLAACSTVRTARIPLAIKFILQLIGSTVAQARYTDLRPRALLRRFIIKTDARAQGDVVAIGGFLGVLTELGQMRPTT
eukprot:6129466-Amphidinium_carterae.1